MSASRDPLRMTRTKLCMRLKEIEEGSVGPLFALLRMTDWRETALRMTADVQRSLSRMASATSLVRSLISPAGPTHDGQPDSQGQDSISSRVRFKRRSQTR